jgi:hypothetical protein
MLYDGLLLTFKENFMSGRFFKVICAAVLSIGLVGQANAGLITGLVEGEIYEDTITPGLLWEYVGEFDLLDAPNFVFGGQNLALNGLQAAAAALNLKTPLKELALAAYDNDRSVAIGGAVVNHRAFYEIIRQGVSLMAEDISSPGGSNGLYDAEGDASAYLRDQANESYINYVFKAVEVPEPSTLAIFALALCALGARKIKR